MKLETLDLWEEQDLFKERAEGKLGFIGSVRLRFDNENTVIDSSGLPEKENLFCTCDEFFSLFSSEQGGFLFKDKAAMEAFCSEHFRSHIPYTFRRECLGFRVLTDVFAFYIAVTPWNEKCAAAIYIYDRKTLMTGLAAAHGLPEKCFGVLSYSGERILIHFGEKDVERLPQYGGNADENGRFADNENCKSKVSKRQRAAMECGVMYGWHHPLAVPAGYDDDGNYVGTEENTKKRKR